MRVLDQVREKPFRLAIQPLQILEQQRHRQVLALACQQAHDRVEGAIAPGSGVYLGQHRLLFSNPKQKQNVRHRCFEVPLEREHFSHDLFSASALVVLRGDLKIVS